MASRVGLVAALIVVGGVFTGSAPSQPPVGTALYSVRVDPRLCPSPLCGGYWVALANTARTRCADGTARARCYVARAVGEDRHPLDASVPDGALVRGDLDTFDFDGVGVLGVLAVASVHAPKGKAPESGRYYRLVDTGIRCVRAPCFSTRASRRNRMGKTAISGLVLTTLRYDEQLEKRVLAALATRNGVLARGRIRPTPDGGRVFHASRFYLRSQA